MLLKLECDNKLLIRRLKLLTTFHRGQCRVCAPMSIQASTKDVVVVVETCCCVFVCACVWNMHVQHNLIFQLLDHVLL